MFSQRLQKQTLAVESPWLRALKHTPSVPITPQLGAIPDASARERAKSFISQHPCWAWRDSSHSVLQPSKALNTKQSVPGFLQMSHSRLDVRAWIHGLPGGDYPLQLQIRKKAAFFPPPVSHTRGSWASQCFIEANAREGTDQQARAIRRPF